MVIFKRGRSQLAKPDEEAPMRSRDETLELDHKHRESLSATSTAKMIRRASFAVFLGTFVFLFSILSIVNNMNMQRRVLAVNVETIYGLVTESLRTNYSSVNSNEESKESNTYIQKNEGTSKEREGGFCPSIIRNKVGLFDENSTSPVKDEFRETVLLVSSNYAYYNMLQNWEFLAKELGLKWAVLALDDKLYQELGPERAIAPQDAFSVSGAHGWREGQFQTLSCNKMRMALEIANNCNVNVVFTDVDNIFLKNPFEHDLGRLIRSNRYDYLYQPNEITSKSREHRCMKGKPPNESNTGFYFIRHGNEVYKRVVESTLERCQDPKNTIDDQTLFWQEFWKVKKILEGENKDAKPNELTIYRHCGLEYDAKEETAMSSSFNYCCLDPYYYPIGKEPSLLSKEKKKKKKGRKPKGPYNKDPVTYHANHARNYKEKVKKLISARSDKHGWDKSRFQDGIGAVLEA